jgi:hypothetical protein
MSVLPTTGDLVESGPRAALILQSRSSSPRSVNHRLPGGFPPAVTAGTRGPCWATSVDVEGHRVLPLPLGVAELVATVTTAHPGEQGCAA